MTPILLTGFIIHSRPYQEKRAIYQLFSREWGVVHGVGVRGVPSFALLELFVTGQNTLKNFKTIDIKSLSSAPQLGQNYYALLYLNELICKLIVTEHPCPKLWQCYHESLQILSKNPSITTMKLILRQFEQVLFKELGVSVDWAYDSRGQMIQTDDFYEFIPNHGFVKSAVGIQGEMILTILNNHQSSVDEQGLGVLGQIHRQMIDYLLDGKPLHSRKLWAEQLKYR